jgi:hypothetical protein
MQKTQPFCCCRGMFASLLHSNSHSTDHIENTLFPIVTLFLRVYSLSWECDYLAVAQKRSLFTQSFISSQSLRHIATSLRLFIPNSLQVYHHFFSSEGCACDICAWSQIPPRGSVFHGVCSPTGPTTPSLSPLVLNGSLTGWQSVQVYHCHLPPVGASERSKSSQCLHIYGSCSVCHLFLRFRRANPYIMFSHLFSTVEWQSRLFALQSPAVWSS